MKFDTQTVDSATIAPGRGSPLLRTFKPGTKVRVTRLSDMKSAVIEVGYSTGFQLCAKRGSGDSAFLTEFLRGASRTSPIRLTIELIE